jgi:hypothetical protein
MVGTSFLLPKTSSSVKSSAAHQGRKDLVKSIHDSKVTKIILDQYSDQLTSRDKKREIAEVKAKAFKSKLNKQKLRDLKRAVLQDGNLVSSNFFSDIRDMLNHIGCRSKQDFFVSILHLVLDLYFAESMPHYLSAVAHFIRSVLPADFIDRAFGFFSKFVEPTFTTLQDGKLFGEETIENLSDLFKMKATALKSNTWKKLCEFFNYVLCLMLGIAGDDENSFMSNIKHLVTKPIDLGLPLLMGLFESLIFLIRQGYQAFHLRTPMSFFYEETSLTKWVESVDKINLDYININSPDPLLRRQRVEILADMTKILEKGKNMKGCVDGFQANVLKTNYTKLMSTANDLHNSMTASKFRRAPFVLLINGVPSVGKTSFVNHCSSFFASVRGLTLNDECRYVRQFMDAFWSGLKSTHWFILFDDIAYEHPNKVVALQQSSLGDFIQVANNVVMAPNMANLEEKGRVFCMPELLIGTTNCKHLNAQHLFQTPYAVNRRFPYVVTLVVKEQVRDNNQGLQLNWDDPALQNLADSVGDDWWYIMVEKPVLVMKHDDVIQEQANYKLVGKFETMTEFRKWLKQAIENHVMVQDQIIEFHEKREKIAYCNVCCEEQANCSCVHMQDGYLESVKDCLSIIPDVDRSYVSYLLTFLFTFLIRRIFLNACVFAYAMLWGTPFSFIFAFLGIFGNYMGYAASFPRIGYAVYLWCPKSVQKQVLLWFARHRALPFLKSQKQFLGYSTGLVALLALYKAGGMYFKARDYKKENDEELYVNVISHYSPKDLKKQKRVNADLLEQISVAEERERLASRLAALQGGVISTKIPDVYYSEVEKSIAFDYGDKITSWKSLGMSESLKKIEQNVVRVHCKDYAKTGCGVLIKGQVLLTNYHLFAGGHTFRIYHSRCVNEMPGWMTIPDSDIILDKDKDLMAIRFRNLPPCKDLSGLIPLNNILDLKCAVSVVTRIDRTNETMTHGSKLCRWSGTDFVEHEFLGRMSYDYYSAVCNTTIDGDCGSPYVAHTPFGPAILAIHQNFKDGLISGVALTREYVNDLVAPLYDGVQGGSLLREGYSFALQPWSMNSNLRRIENAHCYVFGTSQRRFPSKSHVERSLIYHSCVEHGFKDEFAKPVMRHRDVWINQATPMVARDFCINLELLDEAVKMFIAESIDSIDVEEFSIVRVLDDKEALNGVIGLNFVDKIPRKTSAGFPYNCSKMKFLDFIGDEAILTEEIQDDAYDIERILSDSCRSMPIFMASLKDEVISQAKAEAKKTRVFTGSPLAFSLIMRKYLLTVNAFIQSHRRQFECCVGVDALGPEWEDISKYLKSFSSDFIAGDYANYDKTMTADLILSAGKILERICSKAGYDEKQLCVVRTLVYDLAFPVCNFDGDIIMTCGSEPSGHPLTVIVNSIVGSLLLRMAFINLNVGGTFTQHVRAIIYGDDNLMASILPEFNHCYLQRFFASQGLVYTMAEKGAESVPFIPFEDCTFLKRDFFLHPELNHIVGRLSEKSIRKMLMYRLPKGSMDASNHAIEVMDTSCREMFFWGKEKFESHRDWCLGLVKEYDLHECVGKASFSDFNTLSQWYLDKWSAFQELPVEERTFCTAQLQDGDLEDAPPVCPKCGCNDCLSSNIRAIVCKRCLRCRPPISCRFDKWFLGCLYCEDYYPLHCDSCYSMNITLQVYERDGLTTHFYCRGCVNNVDERLSYVVLVKRNNNFYRCDPVCHASRYTRLSLEDHQV